MSKNILLFFLFFIFFQGILQSAPSDSLALSLSTQNNREKVSALLQKADEITLSNSDSAFYLYKIAEKIATGYSLVKPLVKVYYSLGAFYFKTGNLDSALLYYQKGIELCEQNNMVKEKINCKSGIGAVYFYKADYPIALKWYYDALDDFENYRNDTVKAAVLNKLAGVYYKLQDYKKTLEYLHESLKLKEQIGDSLAMSKTYNNLGNVYADLKDFDKALYYYNKDLEISTKKHNLFNIAISNTNIASVYREKGNYQKALKHAFAALKIDSTANDLYGIAADYTEIYYAYIGMKKYDKAIPYMQNALKIARQINADDLELIVLKDFSDFYVKKGDYKHAFEWYKQHAALKDSVLNATKNKQIVEADKKYETQKKNAEIQRLKLQKIKYESRQKIFIILTVFLSLFVILLVVFFRQRIKINRILNEKNLHLKQLNETQNRLMSIISHDFKAPLSAFYSITNSLKTKFDKLNRQEIDNYLNRMLNSAIALKLQLENMLNWAINQQREIKVNKSKYNLLVLISKTVIILQEFANEKSIKIENTVDEDIEIETDGRLLSIVINNLISNAVKFSYPDSKVTISAQKKNRHIVLSVKDFGKGMNKKQLENLFSENQNTTQSETGTGLGLIVSKDIIGKLGGKIWAESKPNEGTEIFIEL